MSNFLKTIDERILYLKEVIRAKEEALKDVPAGSLNVFASSGKVQFYLKNASDKKRKYLRKDEAGMIQKLCQKEYDQKVLAVAAKELHILENCRHQYPITLCEEVFENIHKQRQLRIDPIIVPEERFVAEWKSQTYINKPFHEDYPEYYTDREERVRSKTEVLIANALNKYNIPYKYECPLSLDGNLIIHPDFTVLNVRHRKEYYLEHFGMMDDEEYMQKALKRIELYEKNNIFPGERLIVTHETSKYPINLKLLDRIICHYFL